LWREDVHKDNTTQWAKVLGIQASIADTIGVMDAKIDDMYNPVHISEENWSWHFNRAMSAVDDSRLKHKDDMVQLAKYECDKVRDKPGTAAVYLGYALHPLQDWVAHGDYNRKKDASALTWPTPATDRAYYIHNYGAGALGSGVSFQPDKPELDASGNDGRATIGSMTGMKRLSNNDLVYWTEYHPGSKRITLTKAKTVELLAVFQSFVGSAQGGCKCKQAFLRK
jgi:hypothetical protein